MTEKFNRMVRLAFFPEERKFWLMTFNKRTKVWDKLRLWQEDGGGRLPFNDGALDYMRKRILHRSEMVGDDALVDRTARDLEQKKRENLNDDVAQRAKENYRQMTRDKDLFKHKKRTKDKPIISLPPKESG